MSTTDATWVVDCVQRRLAEHGTWDEVRVSDAELQMGQWLFRIGREGKLRVFAVPSGAASEAEVELLVDLAVARINSEPPADSEPAV